MKPVRDCTAVLVVMAVGFVGACSEDDPIEPIAQELADVTCGRAYECCTATQLADNDSAGTDVATCKQATGRANDDRHEAIRASEHKGRSVFVPAKVAACLASLRTKTCAELNMTNHLLGVPGCESFTEPKVMAGGVCQYDWECVAGKCQVPDQQSEGVCVVSSVAGGLAGVDGLDDAAVKAGPADLLAPRLTSVLPGRPHAQGQPVTPDTCFYSSSCSYGTRAPFPLAPLALLGAVGLWSVRGRGRSRTRRTRRSLSSR